MNIITLIIRTLYNHRRFRSMQKGFGLYSFIDLRGSNSGDDVKKKALWWILYLLPAFFVYIMAFKFVYNMLNLIYI